MSTCSKCKYWENPGLRYSRTGTPTRQGDCGLVDSITGTKLFDSGHGMDISVTVNDDSGLWSFLKTGENFGCINFQPKGA